MYFDYRADPNAQESQFFVLRDDEVDLDRHFPLNTLFNTVAYRKATAGLTEQTIQAIDQLQERFKEARVPLQTFAIEDRATVAIVFERVNRKGVPLDTLQLLSAWTWSDQFDLQQEFSDLTEELEPFGFDEVGMDTNLLLRCGAAVLGGNAAPETLVSLRGSDVRDRFEEVVNGIKGAIDFLRRNLNVYSLENLPFQTLLVPLAVFFATPGNQQVVYNDETRAKIIRWFWKACFSRRYSSGVLRNLKTDIDEIVKLRSGMPSELGSFNVVIGSDFFLANTFKIDSVNTKTFVLLLANRQPLSFVSGQFIGLEAVLRDYNRNEFHHIYPRAFIKQEVSKTPAYLAGFDPNCLANFCFISRADNGYLGGTAPSEYRAKMPSEAAALDRILERALCPVEELFADRFPNFAAKRAELLGDEAAKLTV